MRHLFIITLLVLSFGNSFAQQVINEGKITDTEGQSLPGATIKYQSNMGTVADIYGDFYIATTGDKSIRLTKRLVKGNNRKALTILLFPFIKF